MDKKKSKFTVNLDAELVTDVRNTVYEHQKLDPGYTLTQFIRDSVAHELARLRGTQGKRAGDVSAATARSLRRGRPMKKED